MSPDEVIKKITPEQLYHLRHSVLRPNQNLEDCKYPGDFDEGSFHLGLYSKDNLVCIASFYNESQSLFCEPRQYRLRGMATHPDFRGRGFAGHVLHEAIGELRKLKADRLWCNARVSAEPFYQKNGFSRQGEEFDIPGIGPHFVYSVLV